MKNTNLTEEQIVSALQQRDAGLSVYRICAQFDISAATFYNLRKRYSGLNVAGVKQLRELETERFKLTKQIEVLQADQTILKEVFNSYLSTSSETLLCSRSESSV